MRFQRRILVVAWLLICASWAGPAGAQSATATLSGTVLDETGAVVPGASIAVLNADTALRRETVTSRKGSFTLPVLPPGRYSLRAQLQGFTPIQMDNIVLNVGDDVSLRIKMRVAGVGESVTVTPEPVLVHTAPGLGTVIDRRFVENLPLNGRSFHSLVELTPGVVLNRAAFQDQGQFNVNGQRASANYFMVDGVSANIGVSAGGGAGQNATGLLPGFGATGGMNNLAAVDAMEEFQIKTSAYAAEYGRMPGAQVSIVTRSGSNEITGSGFNYFRDDALDANDWFANAAGLPKPDLRQNAFGGVLGGPIKKDKLFFFLSYEGLRLRQPQVTITTVPSLQLRETAPQVLRPLMDAFPLPNGDDLGNGFAIFNAAYTFPTNSDAASLRLDYAFEPGPRVFARYNRATSSLEDRSAFAATNLRPTKYRTDTLTGGATTLHGKRIVNDLRVNFSRNFGETRLTLDDFGGAVPITDSIFPFGSEDELFFGILFTLDSRYNLGLNGNGTQRQFNLVNTTTLTAGNHQLRLGVDYRYLFPTKGSRVADLLYFFTSVDSIRANQALVFRTNRSGFDDYQFTNFSLFAQDTWRVIPRLTLDYGVRWDVNPAPSGRGEFEWRTVDDPDAPTRLAPPGTPLWETQYSNFAPRLGVAYLLSEDGRSVLRASGGIFYDIGSGGVGNSLSGAPYVAGASGVGSFPIPPEDALPPPLITEPPFGFISAMHTRLKTPYSLQWNLSFEQALGSNQAVTVSYLGSRGKRLLYQEARPTPGFSSSYRVTTNAARSEYDGLQLQFRRRLSGGLQALASYTLSHSQDTASNDSNTRNPSVADLDPEVNFGDSDFDVRHVFTAAASYDFPLRSGGSFLREVARNWGVDLIGRARSGYPITVVTGFDSFGIGNSTIARPDIVPEEPIWIDDSSVAGGRRLNANAFVAPSAGQHGNLERNSIRGFGAWQIDLALRREFRLSDKSRLQFRWEVFNLFNRPNFADPQTNLQSSVFGRATQMLGRSLGSGGQTGGLNPLYQVGGPRSMQFAAKILF